MIIINQTEHVAHMDGTQYVLARYKEGKSFVQVSVNMPMADALGYVQKFGQTSKAPLSQTIVVDGVEYSGKVVSFNYNAGRFSLKRLLEDPKERITKIEIKIRK